MVMRNRLLLGATATVVAACVQPCRSSAAETRVALTPAADTVGIRAYRLGVFPLDGIFHRFDGWLTYDPANRADCRVELHVVVASLTVSSPGMLQRVLGPDFLDAAQYPSLVFHGACDGDGINGRLAMHGVTRPFALALDWRHQSVKAVGNLQRGDWGMRALPVLAGPTVRIGVSVHIAGPPQSGP
jgi:polyisoprenoid-binding protein YceI